MLNKILRFMIFVLAGQLVYCFPGVVNAKSASEFRDVILNENAVVLAFDEIPKYSESASDKMLVIDFKDCLNIYEYKSQNVNNGIIKKIAVSQYKLRPKPVVRITFYLNKDFKGEFIESDNTLQVLFNGNAQYETGKSAIDDDIEGAAVASKAPKKSASSKPSLNSRSGKIVRKKQDIPLIDKLPKEKVSLDFNQADIRDVLRLLSAKSGTNMIYGDDVTGSLTIHLEDVPFNEAFETILSLKGLVIQQVGGNILRVLKPQTLTEERAKAATFTKVVSLNYANADAVKTNLDAVRQAEGRKGAIEIDARTNSLIVTDTPEGLTSIERLTTQLDTKPKQVLIEAKLIEVSTEDSLNLGISWSGSMGVQQFNSNGDYIGDDILIGQTVDSDGNVLMGTKALTPGGVVAAHGITPIAPNSTLGPGTGVNLPGSSDTGLQVGYINDDLFVSAQLNALMKEGRAKILSNPKIATVNNKMAKIEVTDQIPYTQVTSEQGVVTSETVFASVGIKLEVTPTINADNRITLAILPEVSSLRSMTSAGPSIAQRKAETTVIVKNRETLVIGGLIREQETKDESKVPFFGDLPILGYLFKNKSTLKERTELLVFITPKILIE
ncbi:MAG: type IV pilus secretin PilQ [bacterium]